jgi:hypothetical protein
LSRAKRTTALSIAASSLTASMQPSSCIFCLPIRWADLTEMLRAAQARYREIDHAD